MWIIVTASVVFVGLYAWKRIATRLSKEQIAAIQEALSGGAKLLDVRTREEYSADHIDGAINIPLGELPSRFKRLGKKKKTSLVVYCRSGNRSRRAVTYLREQGFQKVLDLKTINNREFVERYP